MTRLHETPAFRLIVVSTLALTLTLALVAITSRPAHGDPQAPQAFHLVEISKFMVGFNGDIDIQAVELKMLVGAENLVTGMQIATYNGAGVKQATLGTFAAGVTNALAGDNILCATVKFRDTFGITPDLLIASGVLVTSGQVSYEKATCRGNVVPYGDVTTPLTSPTVAPPLPSQGAAALVRTVDDSTRLFCPLVEDAANHFILRTGSPTNPIVFRNNARQTVNVFSTVTGVGGTPPASQVLRVFPNPVRGTTRIEAPGWQSLTIHDIRGRLVRVLTCIPGGACPDIAGQYQGEWDGTDSHGRAVPSGIYFLKYTGKGGPIVKRIAVTR